MFYGPLCAALPTLECGILPGLTLAEFDELASKELSGKKFQELISWDDAETSPRSAVYRKMREFDDFLKLRIAESRREKLGVYDPLPEPAHTFLPGNPLHTANPSTPVWRPVLADRRLFGSEQLSDPPVRSTRTKSETVCPVHSARQ